MNKTVSVNISGLSFNIEEEAYQILSRYLSTIRSKFSDSEEGDEILNDIESRIAELFQERINDRKEVVSMADVKEVISIMGEPEDYVDEAGEDEMSARPDGPRTKRQVYRDMDDGLIGGVAAGISAYFGWDPIWLRIGFVLSGIFGGFGILLYIILWIIVPEARTTAEKLRMRGEPVTVENIRRAFKDDKDDLGSKFNEFADDVRNMDTKPYAQKAKQTARRSTDFVASTGRNLGRVLRKIFGVAFVLAAIALLVVLLNLYFGQDAILEFNGIGGYFPNSFSGLAELLLPSAEFTTMALVGLIIVIGIPIIGLLYGGIRLLINVNTRVRGLGIILTLIWFTGIILLASVAFQVAGELSSEAKLKESVEIEQPFSDTLFLDIQNDEHFSNHFKNHHRNHLELTKITADSIVLGFPEVDIVESSTGQFEIEVTRKARASSQKEAIAYAQSINYKILQNDSLIYFPPTYAFHREDRIRGQLLSVKVHVPTGKTVYLKPNMKRVIYDVDNVPWVSDSKMVGHYWTMTERGLDCDDFEER